MKYDDAVKGMNPTTKSALESVVEDYKGKIIDKLLEESLLRNVSLEQISIRDILESESSLETEREATQNKRLKQRLFVLYYVATLAFALSVSLYMLPLLESRLEIARLVADFSQIVIMVSLGIVLVLVLVVMREFRKSTSPSYADELRWSIVKLWAEIEKIANDRMESSGPQSIITPMRIVHWISEQPNIPGKNSDTLRQIISVRNETVHGTESRNLSTKELKRIENLAVQIVSILSKKTT